MVTIVNLICISLIPNEGLPSWLRGKESTPWHRRCKSDPWVGKIPWRSKQQPAQVFLLGESHGQRSLASYSPWGYKESDLTEWLSTAQHTVLHLTLLPLIRVKQKAALFNTFSGGQKIFQWQVFSELGISFWATALIVKVSAELSFTSVVGVGWWDENAENWNTVSYSYSCAGILFFPSFAHLN